MHEETESKLSSGCACYCLIQNPVPSRLLSKPYIRKHTEKYFAFWFVWVLVRAHTLGEEHSSGMLKVVEPDTEQITGR
jgi:hypothetical protein